MPKAESSSWSKTIETNAVALIVHYDGMTDAVPMYQKTSVNLDLQ